MLLKKERVLCIKRELVDALSINFQKEFVKFPPHWKLVIKETMFWHV